MKRSAIIWLVAGAVVVAVVVAGGAWWFLTRPPSAEDAARAYLGALADGDFPAVTGLLADPLPTEQADAIEAAFDGAEGYITEPRIEQLDAGDAGTTSVRAQVDVAGESRALTFDLESSSGRWLVAGEYLATLRVETALGGAPVGDSAWVGGALVPTGTDLAILPAVYGVESAPRVILEGSATAAVSNDEPTTIALEAALTPAATSAAQEQLDAYADECAAAADAVPAHCGLRVPWAADLRALESIAFRVDERPVVTLAEDGTGFDATGGVIVATATGTTRSGDPGEFTYRADDWALRGSVRFEGDEMVLQVR